MHNVLPSAWEKHDIAVQNHFFDTFKSLTSSICQYRGAESRWLKLMEYSRWSVYLRAFLYPTRMNCDKMSKIIYMAYVIIIRCYSNRNPQENTRKMTLSNVLRLFKNILFLGKHYYDYCPIINTSNINKKFLFFTFCAFVDHKHLHTEGILRCNWGYPSCI